MLTECIKLIPKACKKKTPALRVVVFQLFRVSDGGGALSSPAPHPPVNGWRVNRTENAYKVKESWRHKKALPAL